MDWFGFVVIRAHTLSFSTTSLHFLWIGAIIGSLDTTEQLRLLTAHLQSSREEERVRIAQEIHDEMGTLMTAKETTEGGRVRMGDHD